MSEKKRTTVTTIETHEVWVIRRPVTDLPDEPVSITNSQTVETEAVVLPGAEATECPENE